YGHRNAQGLAYGPNGQLYSSEHGAQQSDEFNLIEVDRNYGWPNVQGVCNTSSEQAFCDANNVREPLAEWSPCVAVNGIEYYDHPAIPEWEGKMLMAVLGGFVFQPRISVLGFNEDGTEVVSEDQVLSDLGRLRDIAVNPYTGSVYVATNGPSYPGSGPNRIVEYRNDAYEPSNVQTPNRENQSLKIFPNPATAVINLEFSTNFLMQQFEVFHFNGQNMGTFAVQATEQQLDISNWPAGTYFLRASNAEGTLTRTFTKS
ncbi:MAG: PQQ-dependent sugar dehydrogenase, partial [Bacteroidota bacterium]